MPFSSDLEWFEIGENRFSSILVQPNDILIELMVMFGPIE